jgi:hypothetical protein
VHRFDARHSALHSARVDLSIERYQSNDNMASNPTTTVNDPGEGASASSASASNTQVCDIYTTTGAKLLQSTLRDSAVFFSY